MSGKPLTSQLFDRVPAPVIKKRSALLEEGFGTLDADPLHVSIADFGDRETWQLPLLLPFF